MSLRHGEDPSAPLSRAQAGLEEVQSDLDHTHRLATLGLMAAGVAHEINNMLTPVLAYAQLAQASPEDREIQAKAIQKAILGVENATRIAQAMLGFAGADSDDKNANVEEAVQGALDCLGREPAKDRIRLMTKIPAHASVTIRPLALQQVILNLFLNAITAMRKRGGDLRITAQEQPEGSTEIVISDTGPGIPEDVVGRLFQPFATSSSRRTGGSGAGVGSRGGGSGLGLSICRRLIEESNGSISIEAEQQQGTTVTITLPTARNALAKAG